MAGANPSALMLLSAICWIAGGLGYAAYREGRVRMTAVKAGYGLVAGLFVFGTVNTLILALEHGEASVVIPIANLGFLVAVAISVLWKMERLTARKVSALGLAAVAIILLARADA